MEAIYKEPKAARLAEQCKMGDTAAMLELAYFFRNRCTGPLQERLDKYEADPAREPTYWIGGLMSNNCSDKEAAGAYMMWLLRAAIYGNETAERMIERCPYYKKEAYIPWRIYTEKPNWNNCVNMAVSDELWRRGIMDMARKEKGCSLEFRREKGIFIFSYEDGYFPPDEEGFGAEWDYAEIYFDEFFSRIPAKGYWEIQEGLEALDRDREAYWSLPGRNASERKYRRRLSGSTFS